MIEWALNFVVSLHYKVVWLSLEKECSKIFVLTYNTKDTSSTSYYGTIKMLIKDHNLFYIIWYGYRHTIIVTIYSHWEWEVIHTNGDA